MLSCFSPFMKLLSLLLKLGDMPSGGLALHHPQSVHSSTILPNHAGPGHLDLPVELGIWIDVKTAKDSLLVPQSLKARTGSGQMGVASRIGPVPRQRDVPWCTERFCRPVLSPAVLLLPSEEVDLPQKQHLWRLCALSVVASLWS